MPFGTTEADIYGNWSFTVGQPGQVTYPGANSGHPLAGGFARR